MGDEPTPYTRYRVKYPFFGGKVSGGRPAYFRRPSYTTWHSASPLPFFSSPTQLRLAIFERSVPDPHDSLPTFIPRDLEQ